MCTSMKVPMGDFQNAVASMAGMLMMRRVESMNLWRWKPLKAKTGEGVNVLRFRNAGTDVQVFDLMSYGAGKRFGVYGICDMKDAGRFSASWHAAVERAGSAKRLALREGKMRNARVKGSVQGYDSKYGKGFVYALNEYAAGEPSVYYARV